MYEQSPTGAEARERQNDQARRDALSDSLRRILAEEDAKESTKVSGGLTPARASSEAAPQKPEQQAESVMEKEVTPEVIIDELKPELQSLASQMKQGIIEGRWDSIVGDEVSARLPTLFMHRLMQRYAQEHGTHDPKVVFMAGDRDSYGTAKTTMQEYIASRREDIGERTLLVTEYVTTGDVLYEELNALPKDTVKDVAILRTDATGVYDEQPSPAQRGGRVMIGGRAGSQAQMIHNELLGKAMSGVEKRHIRHTDEGLIEVEGVSYQAPTTQRRQNFQPEAVSKARELIYALADETYEQLFRS